MKKIFILMAMLFISCMVSAEEHETASVAEIESYKWHVSIPSLGRYLDLSAEQMAIVGDVQRTFEKNFAMVPFYDKDTRPAMEKNALDFYVKNMSYVLTDEQMRKYLMVLNVTLRNMKDKVENR